MSLKCFVLLVIAAGAEPGDGKPLMRREKKRVMERNHSSFHGRSTAEDHEDDVDGLMDAFTHDDEAALLELGEESAFYRELERATTRKHPTPQPTPAPTPRPLPARVGHCFGGEELFPATDNGKCYKQCSSFSGSRRRWYGYGNDGYTLRVGPNACAKPTSCPSGMEKLSHHCYKRCDELIPGGLYGLRTGEQECSKADRSDKKTSILYRAGRTSLIKYHSGYCGSGFNVRGYHCGYAWKCPATPRPELSTCEQLYPGYHR